MKMYFYNKIRKILDLGIHKLIFIISLGVCVYTIRCIKETDLAANIFTGIFFVTIRWLTYYLFRLTEEKRFKYNIRSKYMRY